MGRKHHLLILAGLLALACVVQVAVTRRAVVTGLDAVRFVNIAQDIDRHGLPATIHTQPEQPLFPALVWVVHKGWRATIGQTRSAWVGSARLAAAAALVLAIIPLYLAMLRLVGPAAAVAGSLFFCVLPEVSRLGADAISDSTHLLLFCVAFWAIVEYFDGGRGTAEGGRRKAKGGRRKGEAWLLLAGVAAAMAALARAEVLVLVAALASTLLLFQFVPGRSQPWRHFAAAAGFFVLGLAIVLGPYLAAAGCLRPTDALARLLGRHQAELPDEQAAGSDWQVAPAEPMSFTVREPRISIRHRGLAAAVVRFTRKLADATGYWIGALALVGAGCLRRGRATAGDRFVQVFFVMFALAAIGFSAVEGYLAPRHLLCLVVAAMAPAGYGAIKVGSRLGDLVCGDRSLPSRTAARLLAGRASPGSLAKALVVAVAAVACGPQTLAYLHSSRLGHRLAGEWLATEAGIPGAVLDTVGWTGLYSGRPTYGYARARRALAGGRLAYVVVEQRELGFDSDRSRTLRYLLESAAEQAAAFPQSRLRSPNQRVVLVYRWYPERFERLLSAGSVNRATEDRHVQGDSSIRR